MAMVYKTHLDTAVFLTASEKRRHVARWQTLRTMRFDPRSVGTPDAEIFGLTDLINALPGICTVQSCAGHVRQGAEPQTKIVDAAHLWLRVDQPVFQAIFDGTATLLSHREIEELNVRFGRFGEGPIIEIIFAGHERSKLDLSGALILAFLSDCSKRGAEQNGAPL